MLTSMRLLLPSSLSTALLLSVVLFLHTSSGVITDVVVDGFQLLPINIGSSSSRRRFYSRRRRVNNDGPPRGNNNDSDNDQTCASAARSGDDDVDGTTTPVDSNISDMMMMPFYALGTNWAMLVQEQSNVPTVLRNDNDDEWDIFLQGFCDQMQRRGNDAAMTTDTILRRYGTKLNEIVLERTQEIVNRNKQEGIKFIQAFLDEHHDSSETSPVIQTDSGLVFMERVKGDGVTIPPSAQNDDDNNMVQVQVHYHSTLIDGTVVDSSIQRGQFEQFPLASAIPGLREGISRMSEGGQATLIVPSDLAYGDEGQGGGSVPPGAILKFDIELIKVIVPQVQNVDNALPKIRLIPADGNMDAPLPEVKFRIRDVDDDDED